MRTQETNKKDVKYVGIHAVLYKRIALACQYQSIALVNQLLN